MTNDPAGAPKIAQVIACPNCGQENPAGFKFCGNCAAPLPVASAPREQRKTVTVLFCDVTGSTALAESTDPETLRALLARYFERMKAIVEAHGGNVEKFIGDAVMAIFGVPHVHEDDALRAVRAAIEMRDALPELGLQARIGVNTGEVVTGTAERLATGDAVNVAARLEQAAAPGEILIGEQTFRLVRASVEAQPIDPLTVKGKSEPVAAHRLVVVLGGAGEEPTRRNESPMVGRQTELRRLRDAYEQAIRDQSCQLFTVLGSAGVGKSRLAAEFIEGLDATVVHGRCLPYGEGITYWPVIEVVRQLSAVQLDETVRETLRTLLDERAAAAVADEIAWAFRKLLESAARERPLVVLFDDLQWGEETFLDLVEHVADLARDAPILLMCMARPDLLDRRPTWAGGKLNATSVLLEPLSTDETEELIGHLATRLLGDTFQRVVDAAEGNPLFVEEMVALARDSGGGQIDVPPTIQALLAARLDQLDDGERAVLERGAIEGRTFHRGAVQALAPDQHDVIRRLTSLVRKELIRPDTPQVPGDDAFRFRHLLIRDAAYDALPKSTRADLHERFAAWLEEHATDLAELDEVIGYHLEQTCRYRRELGQPIDDQVAARARSRLATAGRRAYARADFGAAVALLERASALLPPGSIDVALSVDLTNSLLGNGRGEDALAYSMALAERAGSAGDRSAELCGLILMGIIRTFRDPEGAAEYLERLLEEAIPYFEITHDDLGLYVAYHARGQVANLHAQSAVGIDAYDRAAEYARRLGLAEEFLVWRAVLRSMGPTPASEFLAWLEAQNAGKPRSLHGDHLRGNALAMLGRIDEARAVIANDLRELEDRGATLAIAETLGYGALSVEMLAGDAAAAVAAGQEGCRLLEALGERSYTSTVGGMLARALYAADRLDDAEAWADRAAELGTTDDLVTQMLWRQARALVLARRGEHAEAQRLAHEALAIGDQTQSLNEQADAYWDLAEVLLLADRRDEAAEALRQALDHYERKENLVMAERARHKLETLR